MRKVERVLLPLVVSALCASGVEAQACLGQPSYQGRAAHFNAGGEFPDSATAWSLGLGAGKPDGLFANLGGGQVSYEGLSGKATLGFLEFGFQYPVGRVQFCPVAGGFFAAGPDDELARITVTSRGATAGLAAGAAFEMGMLSLIPNAAVKYEYVSQKVVEEDVSEGTSTFDSTLLDLGLALLFRDRISVQPLVHFPLSGEDSDPSVGVYASVGFSWPIR
jgi:hypothetical protein